MTKAHKTKAIAKKTSIPRIAKARVLKLTMDRPLHDLDEPAAAGRKTKRTKLAIKPPEEREYRHVLR